MVGTIDVFIALVLGTVDEAIALILRRDTADAAVFPGQALELASGTLTSWKKK